MDLGWKALIPLSLAWLLVVGGMLVSVYWGLAIIGGFLLVALALSRSMTVGRASGDQPPASGPPPPPAAIPVVVDAQERSGAP